MNEELKDNEIKDNLGRIIRLKEINGKTRIAFYRALGAKDAANVGIIGEYWPVMAVDSIDEKPCFIKALVDIEYIYNELDKSNSFILIDEWLRKKEDDKKMSEKEEKDLKK